MASTKGPSPMGSFNLSSQPELVQGQGTEEESRDKDRTEIRQGPGGDPTALKNLQ